MFQNNLIVSFFLAALMAACSAENAPLSGYEPLLPPSKQATPAASAPSQPEGLSSQEIANKVSAIQGRAEELLLRHRAEIDAAFASGECDIIDAKLSLVENGAEYADLVPAREPGKNEVKRRAFSLVERRGLANHLVPIYSALADFNKQYASLGCELGPCGSRTVVSIGTEPSKVRVTVRDNADGAAYGCIGIRNGLGARLLGVRLLGRLTKQSPPWAYAAQAEHVPPEFLPDPRTGQAGTVELVESNDLPYWFRLYAALDCDRSSLLPGEIPFPRCRGGEGYAPSPPLEVEVEVTVTPILAPAGLFDARECADVRSATGSQLSDRLCLEVGGRIRGGHGHSQCDLCPLTAAERNAPRQPSGEPDCPGPRGESPTPLSDPDSHDSHDRVHSL